MSFRDLRNLSEILRNVNFPRLISLENFRNPNFKLVAEICLWLIKEYDPDADKSQHNIETEAGRVRFTTYFAEFMLKHVQVKLNTKRLYQSDGYAVKELLKVATVLDHGKVDPFNLSLEALKEKFQEQEKVANINFAENLEKLKRARKIGIKITQRGGALYDILGKEITLREARYKALSKGFELEEVTKILQVAIKAGEAELSKSEQMHENVAGNVATVQAKIEKKRSELERSQKRLSTLKKVKPAFMDEYEKLQSELEKAYREYVVRFRVLSSLHNQVTEMERVESERKAEERLIKQELATGDDLLLYQHRSITGAVGNSYGSDDSDDEDGDGEGGSAENSIEYNAREFMVSRGGSLSRARGPQPQVNGKKKPGLLNGVANGKSARKSAAANKPKMYGNLMNGDDDEDESESELLLDDNLDQSELLSDGIDDDDDDIDNELLEMGSDISGRAPVTNAAKAGKSTSNGDGTKTYQKDSRASAANNINGKSHTSSSMRRGSNAKVIGPTPAAPSTSSVTIYNEDDNEMGKYANHVFNDQDLVVPNGMIAQRPPRKGSSHFQQETFISDEVDGFGDSSLTKPLEAPKTSTAINSLTYRKSSKAKASSRGGRSDHDGLLTNGNGNYDGYNNSDINEASQSRKKSSSRGHQRSESGSSSSRSRPESKPKTGRQHNGGQLVSQPSIVHEEEREDFGGEFDYQMPTRVERPPSRPGSHYARKRDEMLE